MNNFSPFSKQLPRRLRTMNSNKKVWIKHSLLLILTFITCTISGIMQPFGIIEIFPELNEPKLPSFLEVLSLLPIYYSNLILTAGYNLFTEASVLSYGLKFSISLLFILAAHEAGHYITCRIYRVDATLPYFIPTPPLIGPAGTFGAFIKILSPMPSRRAIFDISVAGPIAGFIALLPVTALSVATTEYAENFTLYKSQSIMTFSNPLILQLFSYLGRINTSLPVVPNPFYFAAWLGLLITALNLIPSGQLDGGHVIYAVFGEKVHYWTGRISFVAMSLFSALGLYFYASPSGFLFVLVLAIMLRVKHPAPIDSTPLDLKRKLIALLTLLIFISCFVPFPIQLN